MSDSEVQSKPTGIPWCMAMPRGIHLGLTYICLFLLLYWVNPAWIRSTPFGLSYLALFLGWGIWACQQYRRKYTQLPFKAAFTYLFLFYAAHAIVTTLWEIVVFHLMDPDLVEVLVEAQLDSFWAGPNPEAAEVRIRNSYKLGQQFLSIVWSIAGNAVFAAILALFLRRNPSAESTTV